MKNSEQYRPSSGTEGMMFQARFCDQCIHEKWNHTQKDGDKKCDILNRSILHDLNDPEYPEEWIRDPEEGPICTKFHKWDWGTPEALNEPDENEIPIEDPNQLKLFEI